MNFLQFQGAKTVQKATSRRKKSTISNKPSNNTNTSDSQSRLSMFGFQKKSVLKH